MLKSISFLVVVLLCLEAEFVSGAVFKYWQVKAHGQLVCRSNVYTGPAVIALWEADVIPTFKAVPDFVSSVIKGFLPDRDPVKDIHWLPHWDTDEFVTSVKTEASNGTFSLKGSARETVGSISPYIVIYHRCGLEDRPSNCYMFIRYEVPPNFIGYTDISDDVEYDLSIVHLRTPSKADGTGFVCEEDLPERLLEPLKNS